MTTLVPRQFPNTRLRRLRSNAALRQLTAEASLSPQDLIAPVFLIAGQNQQQAIASMPGIYRLTVDRLIEEAQMLYQLGIRALALFPVLDASYKNEQASEAYNEQGLVPCALRQLKQEIPQMLLISDIALDPYTSHGQDGLVDEQGKVLNDPTLAILKRQALCYANAGSDILAPSDMMDGRIGVIRQALEEQGFQNTAILSYAAKYASHFYGPFRDAVASKSCLGKQNKSAYQMNPANRQEALQEVALDLQEGADLVMVKPGLPYLDVLYQVKQTFQVPTLVYQVSGEYSMLKASAKQQWLDEKTCALETLLAFKRAGADAILTYYAKEAAQWLNEN